MSVPINQGGSYMSSALMEAEYYIPDNQEGGLTESREKGGIGLSDPSAGLWYQNWVATYNGATSNVEIEAPNSPISTLFNQPNLTELSLAFDQNMKPFIAFVESNIAKFWWYDTDIENTTISTLPAGSLTPRCCLDDKRLHRDGTSDIILCYIHNGALKKRIQRERYTIEYTVVDPFIHPVTLQAAFLKKVGMNKISRLQWTGQLAVQ